MNAYEEYQTMTLSLSFEEMERLHGQMLAAIGSDQDALELYDELLEKAFRYANTRAEWTLLSLSERANADSARTSLHNSLIVKFNQLARYLAQIQQDTSWRSELGYEEENPYNRKRIGDMACYLAFVCGCCSR